MTIHDAMRCIALASGSKGNCLYIEGSSSSLLVDAGLSRREILSRLHAAGGSTEHLSAILVTHEHIDHIASVEALARHLSIPVYATGGTLLDLLDSRPVRRNPIRAVRVDYGEQFSIGDFSVEAFEVSHDAREPCGFLVREGDLTIGCCTDTGMVNGSMMDCFCRCDALVLESNHCPEMLKNGPYPEVLKRRIRSRRGHLSNPDAARCVNELCTRVHTIMLAHLSETNNTPEKALATARQSAGLFSSDLEITVATNPGTGPVWPRGIRL
ncbi:MAG: ribonuclease Z [Methanoregulaceae archaeon PtaB.Bin056]|nr:MAG: ribonuclease Z [Methanoregulaceae archaeon PtaB.Bin056]